MKKCYLTIGLLLLVVNTYAQRTLYSIADGAWDDLVWAVNADGPPHYPLGGTTVNTYDNVIIRHDVTFDNPDPTSDYEHFGDLEVQAGASLTMDIGGQAFIHRRSSFDLIGSLVVNNGDFHFGRQWDSDEGFFTVAPTGTASFADNFYLNSLTELLIDNTACDAFTIGINFILSGSEPRVCGLGQLIVPDCQVFNSSANPTALPQLEAEERLEDEVVCSGFHFYGSEADCASGQPKIEGQAGFTLPVELVGFTVVEQSGIVTATWSTATELNNSHFVLERSANGKRFEAVTEVVGAGTSQTLTEYEAVDPQAAPSFSYYRLKQVDFDGAFTYSSIVNVVWALERSGIRVSPNPISSAGGGFQVWLDQWPPASPVAISLWNSRGQRIYRVMKETDSQGNMNNRISPGTLSSGVYVLRVETAGQQQTLRLVQP